MKIPIWRKAGYAATVAFGCVFLSGAEALALPSVQDEFWDTTRRVEPVPNEKSGLPLAAAFDSGIATFGSRDLGVDFNSFISTMKDAIMLHRFTSFDPMGLIFIFR